MKKRGATKARMKELRRKYGLGEFAANRRKSRPKRRRARRKTTLSLSTL
jgi:hypothetical protein